MIAVTYCIELLQPLLATSLDGEPNSAVSFDYIPGSLVRGAVAAQLAQNQGDLATDERALIFNAEVRYLNAYPVLADDPVRRLPVPLSWKVEKEQAEQDAATVWDFAQLPPDKRSKLGQVKDLAGFTLGLEDSFNRYRPGRQIAVHTLRDRNAGRSTQALGSIYRYDALAPGENFHGAVLAQTEAQAARVLALLNDGIYYLGGVQGGGYGKVKISQAQVDTEWGETPGALKKVQTGETFRITLLSDGILRTSEGNTTVDIQSCLPWQGAVVDSYRQVTYVGGFNRKWGLPLPQEQALRAGSVFVFQAGEEISADRLKKLVEEGIGERRAEGFGRLAINWGEKSDFISPKAPRKDKAVSSLDKTKGISADAAHMAQRMERRLHRRNLDKELIRAVEACKVTGEISNSQLARLRIIARSALAEQRSLERLVTLFQDRDKGLRPTALKKYNRVRVGGKRLPEWVSGLAQDPKTVWQILSAPGPKSLLTTEAPADPKTTELTLEYTVRLIDGVLEQKMKENR